MSKMIMMMSMLDAYKHDKDNIYIIFVQDRE